MLEDHYQNVKSYFSSNVQSVARIQENRNRVIALVKGDLVQNTRSESNGVSARVYNKGSYGFASMADLSEEAIKTCVKEATTNASLLNKYGSSKDILVPSIQKGYIPAKVASVDFEQNEFLSLCKEIDAHIVENYPDLLSRTVFFREDSMEKIIYTSDASDGHQNNPRSVIIIELVKEGQNGSPLELTRSFGGYGNIKDYFENLDFVYEEIAKLYKQLCDKCEGVYAEAGMKTVILGPSVAGMIAHEAVGHTVEADLVNGGSVAGPNLNKQVASKLVNIVDYAYEPIDEKTVLPVHIDDEGVPCKDAVLIKDGILMNYMHNRVTAAQYGVEPCGNAHGNYFDDEPLIRMRNTTVLPGNNSLEEMIASIDDGYYLINTNNGQADLTGEFMFGITMGYEIKNGKLGKAILDTTVSGIAFEMLKTVDMLSDQLEWCTSGTCGKKQGMPVSMGGPAIRCQIMMGGR